MRLQHVSAALAAVAALASASAAQAQVARRPIPVPQHDRLAHQRNQLQNTSYRLFNDTTNFYRLATREAQVQRVVYDRHYGRRVIVSADPSQRVGLNAAAQLNNAASQMARFQSRFDSCGAYERSRGFCNISLAQELSLLNSLRHSFDNFRMHARQLRAARLAQGNQLLTQIQAGQRQLVNIYRQAGVIDQQRPTPRPVPGRPPLPQQPLPPRPVQQPAPRPAPYPAPQPAPIPAPAPAPAPAPGNPSDAIAQAQPLAAQIAEKARLAQQQAQPFRQNTSDEVAVESIDGLVLAVENLIQQLRAQDLEEAKFSAQQLEAQFNAADAAVELALQRSSNLAQAGQLLKQAETSVRQLTQLLGTPASIPNDGHSEGGYNPGDRPPYED